MSRYLSFPLIAFAALTACRPVYREPSVNEPHAVVKVRIRHHATPGPRMQQIVRLDEESVPFETQTFAVRVRPKPSTFELGTVFSHVTPQIRTRQVSESYACGSSYGGGTRYCTRYRTETYTDYVTVIDATCDRRLQLLPRVSETYLLQYDFYANDECSLKCFVQRPNDDGEFDMVRCDGT